MISIIVPVYKAEKYLDKCIESLINQTYQDIEMIFIDDGSPDQSGEILDQWALKDSRIKVIHQENGGPSKARNRGINEATGEEIIFVDGDDIVSEDMCQVLHDLLEKYQSDIAIAGIKHLFDDQEVHFQKSNQEVVMTSKEAILDMWYQKRILPSPCSRIFKKELFNTIQFKEGIIFEDVEILPKLFQKANTIVYTESELYGYYHHEESITINTFSKKDLGIIDICKDNLEYAKTLDEDYKKAALSYYVVGALRIYLNAPKVYQEAINESEQIIKRYGKTVLKDKNIRSKLKYSLILFFYFRPLLKSIYRRINRWK